MADAHRARGTTQIGTRQITPVAIAVLTTYLAVSGSGTLVALVKKAGNPAPGAKAAAHPSPSPVGPP